MTNSQKLVAQLSLASLWIFTGLTSFFFAPEVGYEILETGGITGRFADFCLVSGAMTDIVIGVWVLSNKQKRLCCYTQMTVILIFTLLLTIIAPSFWIHPFGPVTKNLPILVLVWIYYSSNNKSKI